MDSKLEFGVGPLICKKNGFSFFAADLYEGKIVHSKEKLKQRRHEETSQCKKLTQIFAVCRVHKMKWATFVRDWASKARKGAGGAVVQIPVNEFLWEKSEHSSLDTFLGFDNTV